MRALSNALSIHSIQHIIFNVIIFMYHNWVCFECMEIDEIMKKFIHPHHAFGFSGEITSWHHKLIKQNNFFMLGDIFREEHFWEKKNSLESRAIEWKKSHYYIKGCVW